MPIMNFAYDFAYADAARNKMPIVMFMSMPIISTNIL